MYKIYAITNAHASNYGYHYQLPITVDQLWGEAGFTASGSKFASESVPYFIYLKIKMLTLRLDD